MRWKTVRARRQTIQKTIEKPESEPDGYGKQIMHRGMQWIQHMDLIVGAMNQNPPTHPIRFLKELNPPTHPSFFFS